MVDQFTRGMAMMRKHDPQLQEDGFALVKQVASEHVAELVVAYSHEEDHGLRCWFLELIGETRSPTVLPVLSEALNSTDEALRTWARIGLENLDSKEARTLLRRNDSHPSLPRRVRSQQRSNQGSVAATEESP